LRFIEILAVALALAMDAFAVAIASSVTLRRVSARQSFRLSFHFGLFQFLMPVVGWLAGAELVRWFSAYDHWAAFALLSFIGVKMVLESRRGEERKAPAADPTRGVTLVVLSVATSMDALAVGISFGMLHVVVWVPAIIIGLVAAGATLVGLRIGARLGERFGRRMEVLGGLVLIAIGVVIIVEHMRGG
jgi:putative Mn2+ efflux pump MntP